MNRFIDLFHRETPVPTGQIYADDRSELFPSAVAECPQLRPWSKKTPVPETGTFLLLGVATWSGYDMRLLDLVVEAETGPDLVGVFDLDVCQSPEEIEEWIPGIGDVTNSPVVGLWQDGRLVEVASGPDAQDKVLALIGHDTAQAVTLLDPFTQPAPVQ